MIRVRLRDTQETVEDFEVDGLNANPSRHSFAHPGRRKAEGIVGDLDARQGARVAARTSNYLDEDLRLGELEVRRRSTVPVFLRVFTHRRIVDEERLERLGPRDIDLLDTARQRNPEGLERGGT